MKPFTTTNSLPGVHFYTGLKLFRDFTCRYSKMKINFAEAHDFIFPRIGFLVLNLITGKDYYNRFLNYNLSVSTPNHFYITGLFSKGSLYVTQKGYGGGFSMKIHPVVGYHLFKIPMYQLTDRQVLIHNVLGKPGNFIRLLEHKEEITSLDNPHVANFFCKYLPDKSAYLNDPIFHVVNKIIERKGRIHVKELAGKFHMSVRTLHRQFLLKVGLAPQAYARIWQQENAMRLILNNPGKSLADIAYDAGYYDVAHLARDFRSRVALSPSQMPKTIDPMMQSYLNLPDSLK